MIQEKYNQTIYDSADESVLKDLSHLRSNAFSVVDIRPTDIAAVLNPDSTGLVEWLDEQVASVDAIAFGEQLTKFYDLILMTGQLSDTPATIYSYVNQGGTFAYATSPDIIKADMAEKLLKEAGFNTINRYYLKPDYLYTTEIFSDATEDNLDFIILGRK